MKKKLISCLLIIALLATINISAYAFDISDLFNNSDDNSSDTVSYDNAVISNEDDILSDLKDQTVSSVYINSDVTISEPVNITKYGKQIIIESGATLTIAESGSLSLCDGSQLTVKGTLNNIGPVYVNYGARVYTTEGNNLSCFIGTDNDINNGDVPVIAICSDDGSLNLYNNRMLLKNGGLYRMARNYSFADDYTIYTEHEVFLIYEENVTNSVTIYGPNTSTEGNSNSFARVTTSVGATNSKMGFDEDLTYWWLNNLGTDCWNQFEYTDLFNITGLIGKVASHPVSYLMAMRKWSANMAENNTSSDTYDAAWDESEGAYFSNIVYDDTRDELNSYEMYIPSSCSTSNPVQVILFIHGGGWSDGEIADMDYLAKRYARLGYVTASLDYRLFPSNVNHLLGVESDVTMEDLFDDVKHCVDSIKSTLESMGYTPDGMAVSGYSAGGHLAAYYAYAMADQSAIPVKMLFEMCGPIDLHISTFGPPKWSENWPGGAANYLCCYTSLTADQMNDPDEEAEARIEKISPITYVNSNSVPTVMCYGDFDQTIGKGHAPMLSNALAEAGVDYAYIRCKKSDHSLEMDNASVMEFFKVSNEYLNKYLKS